VISVTERIPDGNQSFDERWRALAEELARDLPADLDAPDQAIQPALPPELVPASFVVDAAPPDPNALDAAGPRDWVAPPEADEHFEPPEPPPVFAGDPGLILAWFGLIGGLVAVIVWAVARHSIDVWVARFGVIAAVLGLGLLLWRMPHSRDPDHSDDGAQV